MISAERVELICRLLGRRVEGLDKLSDEILDGLVEALESRAPEGGVREGGDAVRSGLADED